MATGAKTELTLFRAMRANFCVSRTNETQNAFKLSATSEFTWRREFQSPSDARIFRTVELQVDMNSKRHEIIYRLLIPAKTAYPERGQSGVFTLTQRFARFGPCPARCA